MDNNLVNTIQSIKIVLNAYTLYPNLSERMEHLKPLCATNFELGVYANYTVDQLIAELNRVQKELNRVQNKQQCELTVVWIDISCN